MDFTFSDDQEALRTSVRSVLGDLAADGTVRSMIDGADGEAVAAAWRRFADLGWPALLVPETAGGLGLGLVDMIVVLEEWGRATMPGPLLSSALCATTAAIALGLDDRFEGLATGTAVGTVAFEEVGHGDPVGRVRARAARRGAGWVLDGLKPLVLDGADADWVLVAARTPEGLGTFVIEHPVMEPVTTMDPTRRVARLALDATTAEPVGPPGDQSATWRRIADTMALGLAAELVGVGDAALAMATAYSDARVQFDVPLSSHQVIQHKLVDMLHRLELGRVGVHQAAWALDVGDAHAARSVAIAKATMGEAAVAITADTIQIHGAVGFTWEADAHLLYKRAKQNDILAGHQSWHRRRVADEVLATGG